MVSPDIHEINPLFYTDIVTIQQRCLRTQGVRRIRLITVWPFVRPDSGEIWLRRLSKTTGIADSYVEDFAIEEKSKMARRWDAITAELLSVES
jgi:hypothetical protein